MIDEKQYCFPSSSTYSMYEEICSKSSITTPGVVDVSQNT